MADSYTFNESGVKRIVAAVRKSEQPETTSDPQTVTPGARSRLIRAILLEPLYGHGSALAVRCRRVREYQQQDVQLVGAASGGQADEFTIAITWQRKEYISLPIKLNSTADQFLAALSTWTFAAPGDIWVSGGTTIPDLAPEAYGPRSAEIVTARWSVTFAGDMFDAAEVPRIEIKSQSIVMGGLLISFPSAWIADWQGEPIVEVFEGGLMPDDPHNVSSPPPTRTPLQPGSAILAAWCQDAEGYVVCSAEARKYRVY